MKIPQTLFLFFVVFASCQYSETKEISDYSYFKSTVDSIAIANQFNGIIQIKKGENHLYSNTFGYSDIEQKTPIQANDQFVIGSISKQITAVLVLREYENGTLKLDDKIGKYLTNINQSWKDNITIHHLLTHTHGIIAIDKPLDFEEGTAFQYSQLGYELLAQILEKITNQSFENLSSILFETFGLNQTFHPKNEQYKNLVKGYIEENNKLVYTNNSLQNYPAAGSFISNADDLIKWNQLLHSEKLLNAKTVAKMKNRYATRVHPIFESVEYGYGLLFKKGENDIQIGALGYAPGFVSASYFYPKTNWNLVILENTATNLNDFRKTFKVHTELMELVKNEF